MHSLYMPNGHTKTLLGVSSRTTDVEKGVSNSGLYVYKWEFFMGNGSALRYSRLGTS